MKMTRQAVQVKFDRSDACLLISFQVKATRAVWFSPRGRQSGKTVDIQFGDSASQEGKSTSQDILAEAEFKRHPRGAAVRRF